MKSPTTLSLLALVLAQSSFAGPSPTEVKASLAKATAFLRSISTEGGYLWRYSEDLQERSGENKATATQVWIQPPGTPSVGKAFLRAYEVTREKQHLDAALAAGVALATGQLESGGWDYLIDFDAPKAKQSYRRTDAGNISREDALKRKNISTFDDNNTQSALQFLMALADVAKDSGDARLPQVRAALDYGLKKMLEAQYPNGAWAQRYDGLPRNPADYPVQRARIPAEWSREWQKENYYGHYTLNDQTQRDCILTMLEAHRRYGKAEYLAAAKRGGDFIIAAQLPSPQPAWAQQYNRKMEPAWARAFEPPSVCTGESSGAVRTLIDLHLATGELKYLEPIPASLEWFKRSAIAPDRWARLYELGSNKPVYGDRDGKIHYTLEELSEERRTGYSWQGSYGIADVSAYYDEVNRAGREAYRAAQEKKSSSAKTKQRSVEMAPRVQEILSAQDVQGRWLSRGRIETRTFIANFQTLCDFLEHSQSGQ